MKLIVGIGNPGPRYHLTRHNIGFDTLNAFAGRHSFPACRSQFSGLITDHTVNSEKVALLAPQTYMNASGRSVRQCVDFYKLELEDILVLLDDMNLDVGRLRLRRGGSAGGQKGLADIIRHLGTDQFPRLRIGVGRPPGRMAAADFVLQRFTDDERQHIDVSIADSVAGMETWIRSGLNSAMNVLNAAPEKHGQ
jgi:PTH1 family peptidyl-tRNA hydrolase